MGQQPSKRKFKNTKQFMHAFGKEEEISKDCPLHVRIDFQIKKKIEETEKKERFFDLNEAETKVSRNYT